MGVTKKTWDDFYGDDIDEERMRNITVDDIKPIYRTNYWERCRCGTCLQASTGRSSTGQ